MNTIEQRYKAIQLLAPAALTEDVAASTSNDVDVEIYDNDAMAILNIGACTGTTVTGDITIIGALKATPTVFDQTLATFATLTELSDAKIAAVPVNLHNIVAVAPAVDVSASGTPSFTVSLTLLALSTSQNAELNSATPA
jgi:hypothetical protein